MLNQKTLIHAEEWDHLIILDACRYDYFEENIKKYLDGMLRKVRSPATHTEPWIKQVWTRPFNAVYFSANPMISNFMVRGFYAKHFFKAIADVWLNYWSDELSTVPPENMNKAIHRHLRHHGKLEKSIIHYIQPHGPWIGETKLTMEKLYPSPWPHEKGRYGSKKKFPEAQILESINVDFPFLRLAYRDNLRLVLKHIKRLIPRLKGRVVITSDHGEFLGENGLFGHSSAVNLAENDVLRNVPWFEVVKPPRITQRSIEYPYVWAHLPLSGRLLDVGCCESTFIFEVEKTGRFEVWGNDIQPFDVKDTSIIFKKGDIRERLFKQNFFDVVTAISTIEHVGLSHYDNKPIDLDGDLRALSKIRRMLKPNGIAIVTVDAGVKGTRWFRVYNKHNLYRLTNGWLVEDIAWFQEKNGKWVPCSKEEAGKRRLGFSGYQLNRAKACLCLTLRKKLGQELSKYGYELKFQAKWSAIFNIASFLQYWRKRRYLDEIKNIIQTDSNTQILDIGCGISTVLHYVEGIKIGIDPLINDYSNLYTYPTDITVKKGFAEDLQFPDNSFDVVFCVNVLDHIKAKKVEKALTEMKRVLKPHGFLVLTVEVFKEKEKRSQAHPSCFLKTDIHSLLLGKFKPIFQKSTPYIPGYNYTLGMRKPLRNSKELILVLRNEV